MTNEKINIHTCCFMLGLSAFANSVKADTKTDRLSTMLLHKQYK